MKTSAKYTPEEERDAHFAAMQWFESQRVAGRELLTNKELEKGFMWHGHRLQLTHRMQGIWKPAGFSSALTFKTAATEAGKAAPYDGRIDESGFLRYKFASSSSKQWSNKAMFVAAERGYPLAWLVGVKPTSNTLYYYARFPAFIENIDHHLSEFVISIRDTLTEADAELTSDATPQIERKYVSRWTRARIHQHDFREHVISAYDISCAVCDLPHAQLLEAAHIIPDVEESGAPEISNGLALCRVHHTAYDRSLIGIDATHRIHVAERAKKLETDRKHTSLTAFDGKFLTHIPKSPNLRPDEVRIGNRFDRFIATENSVSY